MASSDQSVTMNDDATTDDVATCPLCTETASEPGDIYRHLMVNHRKSKLSRLVLAFDDSEETDDISSGKSDSRGESGMVVEDSLA